MSNDYPDNKGWLGNRNQKSSQKPEGGLINTITHDLLCLSIGGGEAHYESSLQRLKSESLGVVDGRLGDGQWSWIYWRSRRHGDTPVIRWQIGLCPGTTTIGIINSLGDINILPAKGTGSKSCRLTFVTPALICLPFLYPVARQSKGMLYLKVRATGKGKFILTTNI